MNLAHQITAVNRTVTLDPSRQAITLEQIYPTSAEELWWTCTRPERLARWFEPVDGNLVVGGRYRLTSSGTVGTIERCDSPQLLVLTWEYGGDISYVTLTIAEAPGGARLTIRHSAALDDHWATYGPASGGMGWDESLLALALLTSGRDADPEALQRLLGSDEGRDFLATSARAWRDEHVAAGADSGEAEASARRAYSAYLDQPQELPSSNLSEESR